MTQPTILIVDDEADLRDAIAFDFRRRKYQVLTAANGREAKALMDQEKVDVVLTDVRMPNGDGVELLRHIKSRNAFVPPVIFISGFAEVSLEEAYDQGAEAVFTKPFDRQALFEAVGRALQPLETRPSRRGTRANAALPIGLRFLRSGLQAQSKIRNVGRGGFFVPLGAPLPEQGEEVEFLLQTGTEPPTEIDGKGVVRWTRAAEPGIFESGCGVEILELSTISARQFIDTLNFLKTKSYIPRT